MGGGRWAMDEVRWAVGVGREATDQLQERVSPQAVAHAIVVRTVGESHTQEATAVT